MWTNNLRSNFKKKQGTEAATSGILQKSFILPYSQKETPTQVFPVNIP